MAQRRLRDAGPSDEAVRALLKRYECPVPFHAVRTRFLGTIASPLAGMIAIQVVKNLWGGEFPAFDSLDAANELLQVLVMGLWNGLARHEKRSESFRLTRLSVAPTAEGLAAITLVRREELDGFTEGLFGDEESIELPERGHRALGELAEIRAMMAGAHELATRPTVEHGDGDVSGLITNIARITKIAELELHETVVSCVRARRQMSHALPVTKPVFH